MKSFFSNFLPQKVVKPQSPEEVQEIIVRANRERTPLVPVSSGTNLQDTHLPSVKGAIAVDLSQMNKIIYFDPKNRNAVIEPGVTFSQLEEIAQASGLRTLSAIDVPANGSILGTYLEMMPLYGWPRYHPWELLTMKGFRADGKPFATGQMAMFQDRPDKYSWGVSFAMVSRLFCQAQGTLGIITAVAITLKTATPENLPLFFLCQDLEEVLRGLKLFMATEEPHEIFAVNNIYLADLLSGASPQDLPPWTIVMILRGFSKDEIQFKLVDLKNQAKKLKGDFTTTLNGFKDSGKRMLSEIKTPGGPDIHKKGGKCWVPLVTVATALQIKRGSTLIPKDAGVFLLPLQAGGCFYYQPDLRYIEDDEVKIKRNYLAICEKFLNVGILFPRPSVLIAKQVAKRYPEYFTLLRAIKRAVDPANIMNPGKLAI